MNQIATMVLARDAAGEKKKLQVLLGTFIHSKSRGELEYLHNAAVAVDRQGRIAAVVKDRGNVGVARDEVLGQMGWMADEVDVVQCGEGQFFFPGFIGMLLRCCRCVGSNGRTCSRLNADSTCCRYTCSRLAVPQRGNIW